MQIVGPNNVHLFILSRLLSWLVFCWTL